MRFQCPFCNFLIEAKDDDKGLTALCPSCESAILIPASSFEEGCLIGDFVIREKIGTGSIGTVYKAEQISLGRTVALKVLASQYSNKAGIKSFLKEARQAAMLSHTNLVQALAVGSENKICYMAMNFIQGETVKDIILREGPFLEDEALHIVQQVAEALHYAWTESGLVHRDVKPENIMITSEGIVKLTDLGLAMPQNEWQEGMKICGSPSYMSPEQFAGKKLDCRSDIYSLGVSLYQMLSGTLPFNGDTLRTIARQHFSEVSTPLHKLELGISLETSRLALKMMAKKPENRFNSMEELLENVWDLRQRTAPNIDLVPDVHTISINRLDYSKQYNTPVAYTKPTKSREAINEVKSLQTTNRYLGLLLAILSVIVAVGVIMTVHSINSPAPGYKELKRQTQELKKHINMAEAEPESIQESATVLIGKLGDRRSSEEEILHLELRLIIYQAEVAKLRGRVSAISTALTETDMDYPQRLSSQK